MAILILRAALAWYAHDANPNYESFGTVDARYGHGMCVVERRANASDEDLTRAHAWCVRRIVGGGE